MGCKKNKKKRFKCKLRCEKRLTKVFESILKKKFKKCRPKWLINPKSGRPLELDGYNEELKLAFEYNGKQHYKKSRYNWTEEMLEDQIARDSIKRQLCKENNITLIEVPYTVTQKEFYGYILCILKELNFIKF